MRLAAQLVLILLLAVTAWFEIALLLFVPGVMDMSRVVLMALAATNGLVVAAASGWLSLRCNNLTASLGNLMKAPTMLAWSAANMGFGAILLFFLFSNSFQTH